jgi:hypothetical protein
MKKFILFFIIILFAGFTGSFAARYYVDWFASGANDGSSWDDAFSNLHTAISTASSGDTLFVATGLYPCSSGDKNESFNLKQGVVILGSFAGDEDPIDQNVINNRDFANNGALLYADLALDDDAGGSYDENAYHVVTGEGTLANPIDVSTVLDGFFIYGGNATGDTDSTSSGGGVYLSAIGGGTCNPVLSRLIIFGNRANEGGGMMLYAGTDSECSPSLDSVLFRVNFANGGAGLFCKAEGGTCSPQLNIVDFNYNTLSGSYPGKGTAIMNYAVNTTSPGVCSPTIRVSEISHHEGDVDGGAIYNLAGGVNPGECHPEFINMSFYKNGSYGIWNEVKNGTSNPQLTNVILWNESINNEGGALPYIKYSIIEGSGGSGAGWDDNLGVDGTGNLDEDPLWADPDGRNFELLTSSPALSAGDGIEGVNIGSYQGDAVGEPAKIIIIGSLDDFGHVQLGQSSAEQSYAVKGTNLADDIEIDAPEGFAITTISGDYSGDTTEIILTQSGGTVDSTRIYVRFSPTIAKAYASIMVHTSAFASDKFIVVEGTCYEEPAISVTGILNDFDSVMVDDYSAEQSFSVEGYALTSDIVILAPAGFEISLISSDYSGNTSSVSITPVDSAVSPTDVYVRFAPVMDMYYCGNIVVESTGAESINVFAQGTGYSVAEITVTGYLTDFGNVKTGEYSTEQNFSVEGSGLTDDLLVIAPEGFQVSLVSGDYSGNTDTIALAHAGGTVANTPVYIRFAPEEARAYSADVVVNSTGAEPETLTATGTGTEAPVLSEIGNVESCEGETISGINVEIIDDDVNSVTLDALSDNETMLPLSGIIFSGTGGSRTIDLEPNEGQTGSAGITIIATNIHELADSVEFTLTVNENPTIIDIAVTDEMYGNDGEITVTATSPAGGLEYSLDEGGFQASSTFSGLSQGTYEITVMDANGCQSSDNREVDKISGIYELSESELTIYPVPTDGILFINNIDKLTAPFAIRIYSNTGELVYITDNPCNREIDLTGYSKGLYIIKLFTGEKVYIGKFSVE